MVKDSSVTKIKSYVENLSTKDIEFIKSAKVGSSGHAKGEDIERRIGELLEKKFPDNVYETYKYINKRLDEVKKLNDFKKLKYNKEKIIFLEKTICPDWEKIILNRGGRSLFDHLMKPYTKNKQDETADFLYIDKIEERIISLDIKTEEEPINSRPPNIISAKKLLNLFEKMIDVNEIDKLDILYIGVYWSRSDSKISSINEIVVKDFFKIDINSIPPINFDAADQVQFHVHDLGGINIDRKEFIKKFAIKFKKDWKNHSKLMKNKYISIADKLKNI